MIFLLLFSCTSEPPTPIKSVNTEEETAIFTSVSMDYAVGTLSSIVTNTLEISEDISSVSGDPILRYEGNSLWQLNRYQYDTIRKYDPQNLRAPLMEISVAPETGSSNPHDVAICSEQLFVSLYEQSELLVLDPNTLEEHQRIDISFFADQDGKTEASSLVVLNDSLYLGLQGLDRNNGYSYVESTILEINCATHEISNSWSFGTNIQLHQWLDHAFLVSSYQSESYSGGLYSFAPSTETFTEIKLIDQNISSVASRGEQLAFLSSGSVSDSYTLHCFDGDSWHSQSNFIEYLPDLQINENQEIWVAAHWGWIDTNQAQSGFYRFNQACESLEPAFISLRLAPNSLIFFDPN